MRLKKLVCLVIFFICTFFMIEEGTFASTESIGKIVKIKDGVELNNVTVNIYPTETSNQAFTYINHRYIDDVPVISDNGKRVKIQVNGYTGWIDKEDGKGTNIVLVPLNKAINLSYYKKLSDGTLQHYISSDVTKSGQGYSINVGKAPSFMVTNKKYYSYDSIYFYSQIEDLLNDCKNNNHSKAINKSNPYYNYYNYLPMRSKTAYSVNELNTYLNNNTPSGSVLRNKGQAFIDVQNEYGVNAALVIGVAMNESKQGTSTIAKTKNNIFGLKAVDSNTGNADSFVSVDACIKDFAKNWMSSEYLNPGSWRYNGASLGNKRFGINVKYASDPFWGEKAARYAYALDKYLGGTNNLKDYNQYILGMYTKHNLVKDKHGKTLYNINTSRNKSGKIGDVVVINRKLSKQYEVNSDIQVPVGYNVEPKYNWNNKGYISTDGINIISDSSDKWVYTNYAWYRCDKYGNMIKGWSKIDGKWYFMNHSTGIMKTGWHKEGDIWYYMSGSGEMQTGWVKVGNVWYYMNSSGVMQTGWVKDRNTWYYMNSAGDMKTGWYKEGNAWYYMNSSGAMETEWAKDGNTWYYMDESGVMKTGWIKDGETWYYMNPSGDMKTGWVKEGDKWYFMGSSGGMETEWAKDGDTWYYMDESGVMKTGWIKDGKTWYYMNPSGDMRTGWYKEGNAWYYMNSSGAMETEWAKDGNTWYYMDTSGAMKTGWIKDGKTWYYMNPSGDMKTGWIKEGDKWYYMGSTGGMETEWAKDGNSWYYMDASGVMQTGWVKVDNEWYYLNEDNGNMHTGWLNKDGKKYYLEQSGVAVCGWKFIDSHWYYFDSSNQMVTNSEIDGWIIGSDGIAYKKAKTIVVDPGHIINAAGVDSGSVAVVNGVKYDEGMLNMQLAMKVKNELTKKGYNVIMTRNPIDSWGASTVKESLQRRVEIAENNNADFFVSIHHNKFTDSSAHGTEVWYSDPKNSKLDLKNGAVKIGKDCAKDMASKIAKDGGFYNRGAKNNDFYVTYNTSMPSVLVEAGFISNEKDAKKASNSKNQEKVAKAITEAIQKYIK